MEKNRISFWRNKPTWTIHDLVFLLREVEPDAPENFPDTVRAQLEEDFRNWKVWAPGCPLLGPGEIYPMTTPLRAGRLLAWAESLDGVEVPEIWQSMVKHEEDELPPAWMSDFVSTLAPPNEESQESLGNRERENLLLTIGALAMALVERSGTRTGTVEKPNVSQIANACKSQAGEAAGMGIATLRQRIAEGLEILAERK